MKLDDLSLAQRRAMDVLMRGPAETSNETRVAPRTVVGTVTERLMGFGLVRCIESHKSWRLVGLTDDGRRLFDDRSPDPSESIVEAGATDWISITPAEAFDLLTLASRVDDRSPSEQATLDRLARALERRA